MLFKSMLACAPLMIGMSAGEPMCEVPANWWSNATTVQNVVEFGSESLRLQGGFLNGEVAGTVALPSDEAWNIRFRAHTDESVNLPSESITVFINDEFVTEIFNTPPGTVIFFDHPVVGDSFTYQFLFQSPSTDFGSHMVMDGGFVERVSCAADVDSDCDVDTDDLLQMLAAWGACGKECPEDVDDSGAVDVTDLLELLASWGPC